MSFNSSSLKSIFERSPTVGAPYKTFASKSATTSKTEFEAQKEASRIKWLKENDNSINADWSLGSGLAFSAVVGSATVLIGDALVSLAEKMAEDVPVPTTPPVTKIAPHVPLPDSVIKPLPSVQSVYTPDNSPSLLMGTMQSSEMVATSIGQLTQVLSNNHAEYMGVLASKIQNDFDASQNLNNNIMSLNVIMATILQSLSDSTNTNTIASTIGALGNVIEPISSSIQNRPTPNVNVSVPPPDNKGIEDAIAPISSWAVSAKLREDFLQTPRSHTDSDGDIIHGGSPMEVKADKDAQHHKLLDDQNTIKIDNDDFNPMSLLGLPLIPFVGREVVFDKNTNHDMNPFSLFHEVL